LSSYAIAPGVFYTRSYFLYSDFMNDEKKFSYEDGNLYHQEGIVFTDDERVFINQYFKDLNGK